MLKGPEVTRVATGLKRGCTPRDCSSRRARLKNARPPSTKGAARASLHLIMRIILGAGSCASIGRLWSLAELRRQPPALSGGIRRVSAAVGQACPTLQSRQCAERALGRRPAGAARVQQTPQPRMAGGQAPERELALMEELYEPSERLRNARGAGLGQQGVSRLRTVPQKSEHAFHS